MRPTKATIKSGVEIFHNEGLRSFTREAAKYFALRIPSRRVRYGLSMREIRTRMKEEDGFDDILDTVLDIEPGYPPYRVRAMQLRDEIEALAKLVKEVQPQSVLEIGTAEGGTFYIWSRYLDSAEKIISVDLPDGEFGGGYDDLKMGIFDSFDDSTEMHFIRGSSHTLATYEEVSDLVDDGIDFLFIDGDHTYEGVKQDFEMYSELVSDGGIIAFHDIARRPESKKEVEQRKKNVPDIEDRHIAWGGGYPNLNVDKFWNEIEGEYETREILSHPKQMRAGIGVIYK